MERRSSYATVKDVQSMSSTRSACKTYGKGQAMQKQRMHKFSQCGGVCIRHGAKVKRCSIEECNNHVIKGGVCIEHGVQIKLWRSKGCANCGRRSVQETWANTQSNCAIYIEELQTKSSGVGCWEGVKVRWRWCSIEGCINEAKLGGLWWTYCIWIRSATQTVPNQRASRADSGEKKKEGNASGKVTVLSQEIVACLGGGMIFWDSSSTK